MKTASIKQLKDELKHRSPEEYMELVLRLSRFKKENKELLTYLLFEAHDEATFIEGVKQEMDEDFEQINTASPFYIKKSLRKIIRKIRKYSRYSNHKETEVELMIYFARQLKDMKPDIMQYPNLLKIYQQQVIGIKNKLPKLHEDLQYDFQVELEDLKG
ncbi:hypothetical protein [Lentimicrobium sp. S6]|uniref:hypothetical protein n=1 Tax=Lentimicrobium sp. S6 TaxID=2735872 RepID=UPI001554830B|nr:hypothetical protein [Lentimicrobium sp. S6]NPD45866.1 hypothetical protein [Lentimicrobium sp. S6]